MFKDIRARATKTDDFCENHFLIMEQKEGDKWNTCAAVECADEDQAKRLAKMITLYGFTGKIEDKYNMEL